MQVNEEQNIGETVVDRKTERGLMRVNLGNRTHGFIEGRHGYIVTDIDFCYRVRSLRENIELSANYSWEKPRDKRVLTIEDLRAIAEPITSYREWAHHWGINPRIKRNYEDMACHAHDLGADISAMPEWGEEPKPDTNSANSDHPAHGQASKTEVQK